MNLENLQTSVQFKLWIVPSDNNFKFTNGLVQFGPSQISGEYNLIQRGTLAKFNLRDKHQKNDLNFHLQRGCASIAQIIQTAINGSALLKINFFNGAIIEMGEVNVGLDEQIETTAKRNGFSFQTIENLADLLSNKCLLDMGKVNAETYFLILAGAAADEDFAADADYQPGAKTKDLTSKFPESVQKQMRCFSIYGDGLRIPVERRRVDKNSEIFFATKLITNKGNGKEGSLRLAKGKLHFSNYTRTGNIRALASGSMSRLLQNKGSYLKQWDAYGAVEGELLLSRAKAVGKLEYNNVEQTAQGVKFFFHDALPDGLYEGDHLEITSEEPPYIRHPELTWEQYLIHLEDELHAKPNDSNKPVFGKIVSVDLNSLELNLPVIPSNRKYLILSINGDKIQIERRMKARKLILEGKSANPLLGLLIEENGEIPDIQRVTTLKPMTHFVKTKIFKQDPTEVQIKAIDIGLNTPDIALIQGPPGTGKTTVITAILERLNEEHDKTKSIRGEVLVSGFQHDAVENIVSRLSVNALPAVKFGRRLGDSEFAEDTVKKKINAFCDETAKEIRRKNPEIGQTEDQRKLPELLNLYALSPSIENAINLLQRIHTIPRNFLTQNLAENALKLLELLKSEATFGYSTGADSIRLIRALRISEEGFRDDGGEKAADILENFENELDETDRKVLKKAIVWKDGRRLDFLKDLKTVKLKLLEMYTPKPQFGIEKPREDILELFAQVSMQLEQHKSGSNLTDLILADFLHELENNPDGVREAIEDYNYVFAATTQQAEGAPIRKAKSRNRDEFLEFDTVIIDEAARTSPRDLLIPMAQAKKRIILVGDHRQLPHLIDREVAKALEEGLESENRNRIQDTYTKSMFEYLFNRLQKLEQKDDFQRTITLDEQFRMHSLLGEFVSQNFYYKPEGDKPYDERFKSLLPEELFTHNLENTRDSAAVWLRVPNKEGKEERMPSKSRRRIAEAQAIAEKLKTWIDSDEGKKLSFGVISFYKAQVYAIFEELAKHGITQRSPGGTWEISAEYKFLENQENGKKNIQERCRIGTVDAFQGMEFDVVFLSIVRSQNMDRLPQHIKNEKDMTRKQQLIFGHLMSENRLCVSMSRQKRLLILVGDSGLVKTEIGKKAVPALGNFFDLCSKEGEIL